MSNAWFRMYSEFATDPKVQMLSEAMQRRLTMVMCLRCSNNLVTLQEQEIAFQLRITDQELAETKASFIAKGFVDSDWNVLNWDKRQFLSDSSATRVAKHRALQKEKQKQVCNVTETPSNVLVTAPEQNRTDTEQTKDKGGKPPVDKSGFDEFWAAWPKSERKQDKSQCKTKWESRGLGAHKSTILADVATKLQTEKWKGGFIEAPLVYLNNSRWEDGVTPDGPPTAQNGVSLVWHESARGVDAKAAELGLEPCGPYESRPAFKTRVMEAANPEPSFRGPGIGLAALEAMATRRVVSA